MKKRTLWLIFLITVWLIIGILINIFYLIPCSKQLPDNSWFMDDLSAVTLDYAQKLNPDDKEIRIRRYYYIDYDKNIDEKNEGKEFKEYPFAGVDVDVKIGSKFYIIHIVKSSSGQLFVDGYDLN